MIMCNYYVTEIFIDFQMDKKKMSEKLCFLNNHIKQIINIF